MITPLELNKNELLAYKDALYSKAKNGEKDFHSLLEIICCKENIIDAIKKNKNSNSFEASGIDNINESDLLQKKVDEVFNMILTKFEEYTASKTKKVYISNKNGESISLETPTIIDRIIQTMIANIIEPIMEGQFYEHSYGFRPMRNVENVYAYLSVLVNTKNGRYWIVKGNIKDSFNNINHNIMIDKLYKYGIKDKRLLMVIKKILKAGIVNIGDSMIMENAPTKATYKDISLGKLLANIYLTDFDLWVDNQYRKFKTDKERTSGKPVKHQSHRIGNISKSNLKEGYLIRYATDWIIVTSSEDEATRWKYSCIKFLKEKLRLELTNENITTINLSQNKMDFLGITAFAKKGAKNKFTLRTEPTQELVRIIMKSIFKALIEIRKSSNDTELIENIAKYNEMIREINQFYEITTLFSPVLRKQEWTLRNSLVRTTRKTKMEWVRTSKCDNLKNFKQYKDVNGKTIAYKSSKVIIGLEVLGVGKFRKPRIKAQWINPYSIEGREAYEKIHKVKWGETLKNPWSTLVNISDLIAKNPNEIYNMEYFLNRPIVYNRDKGRCRICNKIIPINEVNIHHKNTELKMDKINKVDNLITLCKNCHYFEHKKSKPKNKAKQKLGEVKINQNGVLTKSPVKPRKEVLIEEIKTTSFLQLGKKYGVSDNAVRKWAKSYGIYDLRKIKLNKNK